MILLSSTTHSLQYTQAGTASSLETYVAYADITTTTFTPGVYVNTSSGPGTSDLMQAPGASVTRQLKYASLTNVGTGTQTVQIKHTISAVTKALTPAITLGPSESLQYNMETGWVVLDANGRAKVVQENFDENDGRVVPFFKVGTASEAAGVWYCYAKDTGFPGAWSPGTPGVNGRATNGMTATDAGCLPLWTPTGSLFLTDFDITSTTAHYYALCDVLWVNTGLSVTTTTAQAITPVAIPSRDLFGSNLGNGVLAGILVTTATTNASAVTTITMSYTNQDGVSGKTATISSFPATAVIGTMVPFQLAAGDSGVRSIQSITLGTTLTAGAISLILYRPVSTTGTTVANIPANNTGNLGRRLWTGSCILLFHCASATTATTVNGKVVVEER